MINQNSGVTINVSEEEKDKLCKAALGLTLQEAESAFALAMVNDGKIDISDLQVVLEEKVQVIKKTGILEFIRSDYTMKDIGGLDNLINNGEFKPYDKLYDTSLGGYNYSDVYSRPKGYSNEEQALRYLFPMQEVGKPKKYVKIKRDIKR